MHRSSSRIGSATHRRRPASTFVRIADIALHHRHDILYRLSSTPATNSIAFCCQPPPARRIIIAFSTIRQIICIIASFNIYRSGRTHCRSFIFIIICPYAAARRRPSSSSSPSCCIVDIPCPAHCHHRRHRFCHRRASSPIVDIIIGIAIASFIVIGHSSNRRYSSSSFVIVVIIRHSSSSSIVVQHRRRAHRSSSSTSTFSFTSTSSVIVSFDHHRFVIVVVAHHHLTPSTFIVVIVVHHRRCRRHRSSSSFVIVAHRQRARAALPALRARAALSPAPALPAARNIYAAALHCSPAAKSTPNILPN